MKNKIVWRFDTAYNNVFYYSSSNQCFLFYSKLDTTRKQFLKENGGIDENKLTLEQMQTLSTFAVDPF